MRPRPSGIGLAGLGQNVDFFAGQSGTRPQAALGSQYLLRAAQAHEGREKNPSDSQALSSAWKAACHWVPLEAAWACCGGAGGGVVTSMG